MSDKSHSQSRLRISSVVNVALARRIISPVEVTLFLTLVLLGIHFAGALLLTFGLALTSLSLRCLPGWRMSRILDGSAVYGVVLSISALLTGSIGPLTGMGFLMALVVSGVLIVL